MLGDIVLVRTCKLETNADVFTRLLHWISTFHTNSLTCFLIQYSNLLLPQRFQRKPFAPMARQFHSQIIVQWLCLRIFQAFIKLTLRSSRWNWWASLNFSSSFENESWRERLCSAFQLYLYKFSMKTFVM